MTTLTSGVSSASGARPAAGAGAHGYTGNKRPAHAAREVLVHRAVPVDLAEHLAGQRRHRVVADTEAGNAKTVVARGDRAGSDAYPWVYPAAWERASVWLSTCWCHFPNG